MPLVHKLLFLPLIAASLTGCRHYAGWSDRRVRRVPFSEETRVEIVEAPNPIQVVGTPSPQDGTIELRVVATEQARRLERREIIGRRAYVPYRWHTPLWKPVVIASVIGPFYLPYADPHDHSGKAWGMRDYLRDVVAYFNIFEAYPYGARELEEEWRVISSEETWMPVSKAETPLPAAQLRLRLDDATLSQATTDAGGAARFDLAGLLTKEMASQDRRFTILLLPDDAQGGGYTHLHVEAETLRALLNSAP